MTQLLETASKFLGSETVATVEKDAVREYLSHLDIQKSMG